MTDAHDCSSSGFDKGPNGVGQVTQFLSATRSLLIGSFRNVFQFRNRKSQNDATTSSKGEHTYYSTAPQELWTEPLSKDLQDETPSSTGEHTYYSTAPQELWTEPLSKDLQDATPSSTGEHTYYSTAPQELWTEILSNDLQDATPSSTGGHVSQQHRRSSAQRFCRTISKMQHLLAQVNTCYSTARQELCTEIFSSEELSNIYINMCESSSVEVQHFRQSDLLLLHLLAEGGQAHVYFAECEKFSTPVVVKRLKHGNVDLRELLRRMEKLMKIRKENNSAICRVFGAGVDFVGNVWVVMERMAGDLRTLIDRRMSYLEDGQMPFDYNNTITMMLHIAQGMENLHRCGLIHADLKASNILVTPLITDCREEEVVGWQEISESLYFYVKIGDFESSDGVAGTQFWRAPEVLQALKNGAKPMLSPAADVYSYGMLCYELLTGRIPFGDCAKSNYDAVLSGKRPELTAHVNQNMKNLLHACWHTDLRQRPGWITIIETLNEELALHAAGSQQPKRRARPRIEIERGKMEAAATTSEMSNLVVTSWEGAVVQGLKFHHRTERFADWKKKNVSKILPEILPIVKVILKLEKAIAQDTYHTASRGGGYKYYHPEITSFSEVLSTFNYAWYVVQENWKQHVGMGAGKYLRRSIYRKRNSTCLPMTMPMRMVEKIRVKDALKSCNLLGPTAKHWLEKILAISEEWQTFVTTSRTWRNQIKQMLQEREEKQLVVDEWQAKLLETDEWKEKLQEVSSAWGEVYAPFHAWHVRSAIALTALEAVENKMHSACREERKSEYFLDNMVANIYAKVNDGPKLKSAIKSVEAWKAVELELVTIRSMFPKKIISIATQVPE